MYPLLKIIITKLGKLFNKMPAMHELNCLVQKKLVFLVGSGREQPEK
jgi:hypothetical protein